jgi:hypothetical protein
VKCLVIIRNKSWNSKFRVRNIPWLAERKVRCLVIIRKKRWNSKYLVRNIPWLAERKNDSLFIDQLKCPVCPSYEQMK